VSAAEKLIEDDGVSKVDVELREADAVDGGVRAAKEFNKDGLSEKFVRLRFAFGTSKTLKSLSGDLFSFCRFSFRTHSFFLIDIQSTQNRESNFAPSRLG
jgi:hypothetical protein